MTWDNEVAKYIVFPYQGFTDWIEALPSTDWDSYPVSIEDAVVIRLKDPFAATALFTYANTILSVLELMEDLDPETKKRMMDIADYFHGAACASQEIDSKRLPD